MWRLMAPTGSPYTSKSERNRSAALTPPVRARAGLRAAYFMGLHLVQCGRWRGGPQPKTRLGMTRCGRRCTVPSTMARSRLVTSRSSLVFRNTTLPGTSNMSNARSSTEERRWWSSRQRASIAASPSHTDGATRARAVARSVAAAGSPCPGSTSLPERIAVSRAASLPDHRSR